ncbi:methyltransferase domain-containing protein [Actinomadura hibisca]|uniref:methyltransferase domain-containing protein n=1 Tax=Actinomadura hibisca TaxID=68565 RepID=UPI000B100E6D|nr:methyltransferase domain-containing protein [Actinomadura hibisca]
MNVPEHIEALADMLTASGELTDPAWRAALHAVPRHRFVPPVAWANPYNAPGFRIDGGQRPHEWLSAAYADQPIITQLDDGATEIGGEGDYTSSLSAPGVVLEFLELLDPYEGDRVLEIGTGSGWTAALLAYRVGDENVTSVEIDPDLLARAAANLEGAGYSPRLVLGDGAEGWQEGAPYDRVHVTAGVSQVPYSWIEQTRPGGVIVFPWMPEFEPGHKVRLIVGDDGTATGRFVGGTRYMMLRNQRTPTAPTHEGPYRERSSVLDPRRILRSGYGADVAIAGCLPHVSMVFEPGPPFEGWLWTGDSGAHVVGPDVRQFGERDLWDELEAAFFRWVKWGQPERGRFGMTVTPDGQQVWLDSPDNPISL